ncbi:CD1871A family CXXC motif-containing protein [Alkaliphilus oremlandii]
MLNFKSYIKYSTLVVATLFVLTGILRKEHLIVLEKAINICLECIGLG